MELSQRFVRKHLERIHPFTKACSLEATRRGQDLLGNVLAKMLILSPLIIRNSAGMLNHAPVLRFRTMN